MKLRPRFFDGTAFKKDITRFAPLWALYLIGGLMLALSIMSQNDVWWDLDEKANYLSGMIGIGGMINIVYGMLCAQLLHGDLFNSKLCNALHAMPLRREGWFVTHMVSGLLFSLVPNTLIALSMIPFLDGLWFTALLWLLGMEMSFVFFFGLATFSIHCTGSRFASIVVYLILNFLSVLVGWFADTMYLPMLYGVEMNEDAFLQFCPLVWLLNDTEYFSFNVVNSSANYLGTAVGTTSQGQTIYLDSFGYSWGYLAILTALGLVFLAVSLLLYRLRKLESAGDFMAFKATRPVFWVLFTLCAGGFMQMVGVDMVGLGEVGGYIFLGLGLLCGYFVAQMLIARTIKVFKKRSFLHLGLFLVAFALSLWLTSLDFMGIARYVPATNTVDHVYVTEGWLSQWTLERLESGNGAGYDYYLAETPEEIDTVRDLHGQIYAQGQGTFDTQQVYITYVMKSGAVIRRSYWPVSNSEAVQKVWALMNNPRTLLQVESLEALTAKTSTVFVDGYAVSSHYQKSLLEALWKDAEAGCLYGNKEYHAKFHLEYSYSHYIELTCSDDSNIWLAIYPCCENTLSWVKANGDHTSVLYDDPDTAAASTRQMIFRDVIFEDSVIFYDVMELLSQDLADGTASLTSQDTDFVISDSLEILFWSGKNTEKVYLSSESTACQYLQKLLETA